MHSSSVSGHYEHPHSIVLSPSDCVAIGVAVNTSDCQRVHLNLDLCKIGPTGFVALLNGIAECDKLETLRLVAGVMLLGIFLCNDSPAQSMHAWCITVLLTTSFVMMRKCMLSENG